MKYWLLIIILGLGYSSNAQTDDIRAEWRSSKKIKLDVLGLGAQFPALIFGLEYPLKNTAFAIEHELGPIFSSSSSGDDIEKSNGLYTNHTILLYPENRGLILGLGVHYRQLNLSGNITACAGFNSNSGGCAYIQLFDEEPVRIRRIAPYLRLRRMLYLQNNVSFSFGLDFGRYFQRITNEVFQSQDLSLESRVFGPSLQGGSAIYFRAHAHFIIKI